MDALHTAASDGDAEEVERLLLAAETEVDALSFDGLGRTALSIACGRDDVKIITMLLDAGAAIDGTGDGCKPLESAAIACNEEAVGLLLERGADKDAYDGSSTALTKAIYNSHDGGLAAANRLLLAGADIHLYGTIAPIHAASHLRTPHFLETLIAMGADVNAREHEEHTVTEGFTPLHYAAEGLCFDSVKLLLQSGANVNALDCHQSTPLHYAARHVFIISDEPLVQDQKEQQSNIVAALIQAGAEVLLENARGHTPLLSYSEYLTNGDSEEWFEHFNAEENDFPYRNYYNLVAAGDRNWDCVPTNFPGLEQALLPVWREAPEELPELFTRLTQEVKERIQLGLRVLHGRVPKGLQMLVMATAVMVEPPCAPSYLIDPKFLMMPAYFI